MHAFGIRKITKKEKKRKIKKELKNLLICVTLTIAWDWRGWSWKLRYSKLSLMAMHSAATTMKCSGGFDSKDGNSFSFSLPLSLVILSLASLYLWVFCWRSEADCKNICSRKFGYNSRREHQDTGKTRCRGKPERTLR